MARTIGHTEHRYQGYKLLLAEKRDAKHGARHSIRIALRESVKYQERGWEDTLKDDQQS